MRIRKSARKVVTAQRDLTAHQKAVLTATVSDERHNAWALEMLGRRNAVTRWRGQRARFPGYPPNTPECPIGE
jgi:hypothetical protein